MLLSFTQSRRAKALVLLFATVVFAGASVLTAAELDPQTLSRKPEFASVQLSPEGKSIAYLRINDDDLISLEVLDLNTSEKQGVAGTENYDVGSFAWVSERELVVLLTQDKLYTVGIFVYDRKTGRLAKLRDFTTTRSAASIVGIPRDRKNRIVTATVGENGVLEELTTKFDMNNRTFTSDSTAVRSSYSPPAGRVQAYVADVAGEPAMASMFEDGTSVGYLLDARDETWRRMPLDLEQTPLMAISADQQLAWVVQWTDEGGTALHTYDLIDFEFGPAVYTSPDYDISTGSLILDKSGRTLQGITYHRVRRHTEWFDEGMKAMHERIATALEGYDVVGVSRSRDHSRAIFAAMSSTEPGQYFLADLKTGGLQHLAAASPWLEGLPLSPMASFNYNARDGLKLQAYLTLPTTPGAERPYPLMVLGHGGPWARDTWAFNAEVQFLASRGIAVLQPNYRGSTGFNYDITRKDRFDFRKMHDDVTDGVNALVKAGIADPDRLGIMGASFGGYLAIAGAAWEPDLYRVAITNVGVFDWDMLISDSRRESYIFYDWLMKNIGSDPAKVEAFSPLNQVDDVKIPIFIAHGRQDIRVDISQSIRLERALRARGIPHETYYEGDSAHGFAAAEAQAAYLSELDGFLDRHFFSGTPQVKVGDPTVLEMPAR